MDEHLRERRLGWAGIFRGKADEVADHNEEADDDTFHDLDDEGDETLEHDEQFYDAQEELLGADEVGAGAPPDPLDPIDDSWRCTQIGSA